MAEEDSSPELPGVARPPSYALTRFVILRLLGAMYAIAFLGLALQSKPLIGARGLLPAASFLRDLAVEHRGRGALFWKLPTLFLAIEPSDAALVGLAWLGFALSIAVALGLTSAVAQALLWALYLSFVHVGQVFYGYGWEIQLCETGFLAIFLCPLIPAGPFPKSAPPAPVIWLFRWLIVRIMLGAGLIKLRGDPCWRDLTCLVYHYETQPIPNPLSPLFHAMPAAFHKAGAAFNHFVEIACPFFAFGPRRARIAAGALFVVFQGILILSGNLSFLNWLTLVPAVACFDDRALARVLPKGLIARCEVEREAPWAHKIAAWALGLVVLCLSVNPFLNLLSDRQAMNSSFDPFALVNTYGAFGSVGRERIEVVIEGTMDDRVSDATVWKEYAFPCKPGDPGRRPCVTSPYQPRLDWQIWFEPFQPGRPSPWLIHLVHQLLRGDPGPRTLLAGDPFGGQRPRFVRASLYRYRFSKAKGVWWERERAGEHLRPVSLEDPALRAYVEARGWE